MSKVNFEKTNTVLANLKNIRLLYYQYCAIVTTPYYPVSALLSVKWSLMGDKEQKKILNFLLSRWLQLLTRGSKYSDLTLKLLVFWNNGRSREVVAGGLTV